MVDKNHYLTQLEETLQDWEERIAALRQQAEGAGKETVTRLQAEIDGIQDHHHSMAQAIELMRDHSTEAWEDLAEGFQGIARKASDAYAQAEKNLSEATSSQL